MRLKRVTGLFLNIKLPSRWSGAEVRVGVRLPRVKDAVTSPSVPLPDIQSKDRPAQYHTRHTTSTPRWSREEGRAQSGTDPLRLLESSKLVKDSFPPFVPRSTEALAAWERGSVEARVGRRSRCPIETRCWIWSRRDRSIARHRNKGEATSRMDMTMRGVFWRVSWEIQREEVDGSLWRRKVSRYVAHSLDLYPFYNNKRRPDQDSEVVVVDDIHPVHSRRFTLDFKIP